MKRAFLIIAAIVTMTLLSVGSDFAQDKKMDMKPMPKGPMDMAQMNKDGHRNLMMAYHRNAAAFTRALWEMSSDGRIENVEMARAAYAEIQRSVQKMDEIHRMHMSTMKDPAMMEKMKPMMDKMEAEKAALGARVNALGAALQGSSPNAQDVEMNAAALLMRLQKMHMPEGPMNMPGKPMNMPGGPAM